MGTGNSPAPGSSGPAVAAPPGGDPVKALMHRHRELCARAVDPLEIAAALEAHGMTDRTAARFRHRDVFSLAEEMYARVPRHSSDRSAPPASAHAAPEPVAGPSAGAGPSRLLTLVLLPALPGPSAPGCSPVSRRHFPAGPGPSPWWRAYSPSSAPCSSACGTARCAAPARPGWPYGSPPSGCWVTPSSATASSTPPSAAAPTGSGRWTPRPPSASPWRCG
ncbi:hypothetical protein ACFQVA_28710 [Actinomadura keratinilytica]